MSRRKLLSRDAEKLYNSFDEVVQYWGIKNIPNVQKIFVALTELKADAIIAEESGNPANYLDPFGFEEESIREFQEGVEFNEEV